MNVVIDGRAWVTTGAGIATFLKGAVYEWAAQRPIDNLYVALPREVDKSITLSNLPANIHLMVKGNAVFRRLPNLIWLSIMIPWLVRQLHAEVYFSPVPCIPFLLPRKCKRIIVVHDVVNIEYRKTMKWTNILASKLFFDRSVKTADLIWTNSHYTREKVEQYFPRRKCQKIVTGCSVETEIYHPRMLSSVERASLLQQYGINGEYILFVGSLEPRKNLEFLLSLMPELYRQTAIQLVVVGAKSWGKTHIQQIVEQEGFPRESVVFCKFVPNEDLARLYHCACCFVSAALNEGFGMPQLEALLCGCPVVTAHNSAMIEVARGKTGATTVEGYNPETWICVIKQTIASRPVPNVKELEEYKWSNVLRRILSSIKK